MKHIEVSLCWKDGTKSVLAGDWEKAASYSCFSVQNPKPIDALSPKGFPRVAAGLQFIEWGPTLASICGAVSSSTTESGDWIENWNY